MPPLVRGLGLTWIPEPQKFFVSFGDPIATSRYGRRTEDVAAMHELRARVASSIETQLEQMQRKRGGTKTQYGDAHRVGTADWDKLVVGLESEVERAKHRSRSRMKPAKGGEASVHRGKKIIRRRPK